MMSEIQKQTTIINDNDTNIMEEVNDNDEVKMPEEFLHSGYVAVATVISFLVVVCVIIGVYYIHVKCALKKKEKREKNVVIESRSPEKLREDSVVIHDVEFPNDDIYGVGDKKNDNLKKPEPSPSVFHDSVFFDDVMTSVAALSPRSPKVDSDEVETEHQSKENSCIKQILNDVINKLPRRSSSKASSVSNEDNVTNKLRRNKSYENAIRDGKLTSSSVGLCFLPNIKSSPESNVDVSNEDGATNELDIDMCLDVDIDESMLDVPRKNLKRLFPSTGKWQSTPILDLEGMENVNDDNNHEAESLHEVDISDPSSLLKVSRSYSPVYKMHNSSFSRNSYLSSMISNDESINNM